MRVVAVVPLIQFLLQIRNKDQKDEGHVAVLLQEGQSLSSLFSDRRALQSVEVLGERAILRKRMC